MLLLVNALARTLSGLIRGLLHDIMDVLLAHNPIVDYVFKAMALRAVRTTANSSQ